MDPIVKKALFHPLTLGHACKYNNLGFDILDKLKKKNIKITGACRDYKRTIPDKFKSNWNLNTSLSAN